MSKPTISEIAEAHEILGGVLANGERHGVLRDSTAQCLAAQISVLSWVLGIEADLPPSMALGNFSGMLTAMKSKASEMGVRLARPDRGIKGGAG